MGGFFLFVAAVVACAVVVEWRHRTPIFTPSSASSCRFRGIVVQRAKLMRESRYGLAEPLRREQELSSVRAGDGMGFTAFRTEKSVSEEILRGEEAEVGGWEGVFGSGELRSCLL